MFNKQHKGNNILYHNDIRNFLIEMGGTRFREEYLNFGWDSDYCLGYDASQDYKNVSIKHSIPYIVKNILRIYIPFTVLVYEINLKNI
jgi:hypothetical protein